eukprot:gene21470-22342_t
MFDAVGGHGDRLTEQSLPIYLAAFDAIDASPSDKLFVAEVDGVVVGTYQFTLCRTLVHHGRLRAMVEAVHVAGAQRGQGIGAAMMRHAQSIAREAGAGVLELTSNKQRHDAHRFYERLGFRRSHDGFKLALDSGRVAARTRAVPWGPRTVDPGAVGSEAIAHELVVGLGVVLGAGLGLFDLPLGVAGLDRIGCRLAIIFGDGGLDDRRLGRGGCRCGRLGGRLGNGRDNQESGGDECCEKPNRHGRSSSFLIHLAADRLTRPKTRPPAARRTRDVRYQIIGQGMMARGRQALQRDFADIVKRTIGGQIG